MIRLAAIVLAFAFASCSSFLPYGRSEDAAQSGFDAGFAHQRGDGSTEQWARTRNELLKTFAMRALERDLVEEGQEYLQEACDLDAEDASSHATLARLFLTENDARASLVYAERGIEASPGNRELSLVYAAALAENDQIERATAALEAGTDWGAIAANPELARAMLLHYASTGSLSEAREFVTEMTARMPGNPYSHAMLGDLFLASGDVQNAARAYVEALKVDPSITTPRSIQLLIEVDDPSVDPVIAAAHKAERNGDWSAAERLYNFLLKAQIENAEAHIGLAQALWRQNRHQEAASMLAQVRAKDLDWPEHMLAAKIAIGMNQWTEAGIELNLALTQRPGLKAAELLLAHVRQMQIQ